MYSNENILKKILEVLIKHLGEAKNNLNDIIRGD
jgi:hypothetical protein